MTQIIKPIYIPTENQIKTSNIYQLIEKLGLESYKELHKYSNSNYREFWEYTINALDIKFNEPYTDICEINSERNIENPNWLKNASLNITNSCFNDSHRNATAIIFENHLGEIKKLTYAELDSLSNKIANSITEIGLKPGDAVAINMPMTDLAVAIYLAIIKSGCINIAIAESFATPEIKSRLDIANAKAIFTQDFITRGDKKLDLYSRIKSDGFPRAIVVRELRNDNTTLDLRKQDLSFDDFIQNDNKFKALASPPDTAINILFSSGTTGTPKAILWDHTSAIKAAADAYYHHNLKPQDIFIWPTSLGWMMGPWLIFATLINKATMALSYNMPTSNQILDFIEKIKVTHCGLVPSIVKAWRKSGYIENKDLSNVKLFTSTGEASTPDDMEYISALAGGAPIIEYCGGTEIAGGYITSTVVEDNYPSCFSTPALGLDFLLLDNDGKDSNKGEVAIIPPSIGLSRKLLNRDHHEVYYQDMPTINGKVLRRHGDEIEKLANGYYRALGRCDDTMNIGGIKISSAEIERCLAEISGVLETAAIAVSPANGGPSRLVIYYVCDNINGEVHEDKLLKTMQNSVKTKLNPLFKISKIIKIAKLPRTSSNKVMRRVLRDECLKSNGPF